MNRIADLRRRNANDRGDPGIYGRHSGTIGIGTFWMYAYFKVLMRAGDGAAFNEKND